MKYFTLFLLPCLFLFSACGDDDNVSLESDIQKIEDYLAENNITAESTMSGLHYVIEEEGEGENFKQGDELTLFYTGSYLDGEVFSEVYLYPVTFNFDVLIAGWEQGLPLIKPGGKMTLYIPSSLGYGANPPNGSGIRKNAILIFEIETVADLAEFEQNAIENYLSENNLTAEKTSSGLHYFVQSLGSGGSPTANQTVTMNYQGYFLDDNVFDATNNGSVPIDLMNVIEGWREGVPLFEKGGLGTLFIPSNLGYGKNPPPGIPQNATLIFDIELVDF